ncbi:hypothetical protein SDC9_07483 [bioreactor metagenome]|uniref:Uncharacterized protein n=1 Tax=bioreactor metagenome TaxID=1076179 RepID=A0A644T506_9ZZZZ|nr:hypothetical protein [Methanobrevibacter sp.]MEA4956937.1 hypothetical protein [Methanobrevibacter sp.]
MKPQKNPLLLIRKNGTYTLYHNDMSIIPQNEETFKKIVEKEKLTVKFTNK